MESPEGFVPIVTINGRPISNLNDTDDIDLIREKAEQLRDFTTKLVVAPRAVGMKISAKKKESKYFFCGGDVAFYLPTNGHKI